MAGRDALLLESFGHLGDELKQGESGIDETVTLARLYGKCGNVVTGKVEQALKTLRFLVRMYVDALTVLDLSLVPQKLSMTSTTMNS
jgi:hypothetical protein